MSRKDKIVVVSSMLLSAIVAVTLMWWVWTLIFWIMS